MVHKTPPKLTPSISSFPTTSFHPISYPTTLAVTYWVEVLLEQVLVSKPVKPPRYVLETGGETVDIDVVVTTTVERRGAGQVDG
jgi:hypothetical protein